MNRSELPADLEAFVQQELAEGIYPSETKLVADALLLPCERHRSHEGHNGIPSVSIGEAIEETLKDIPEEEIKHLPPDAAE
jgi:hypothetical protein